MYQVDEGVSLMINDNLKNAISYDPTKQSQTETIASLNADITENRISLPIYQRDLSWTLDKAVSLFNYQLFGRAPVSPLSFNKISLENGRNEVRQVQLISRAIISDGDIREGQLSVIDGQQRLATNYRAYIDDSEFQNIVLDLHKGKFRLLKTGAKAFQIPVGKLLNQDDAVMSSYINGEMNIQDFDEMSTLLKIRTKLQQYSYTLHIAHGMDEKEQIEWFEVLNNAGSKVSALQMAFAKLGSTEYDIYAEYGNPFKQMVAEFDLNDLFSPYTTNVSYPVALLNPELELHLGQSHGINYAPMPSDTKENILAKLTANELRDIANATLKDLRNALAFFEGQDLVDSVTRMDYILDVAGYFAFNGSDLSDEQIERLSTWVRTVEFVNKPNAERRRIFSELVSDNGE